jgi:isopenicillin N synthase-like dioxygenase
MATSGAAAAAALDEVPVLDLQDDTDAAAQCMDAALRRFGFFYVRNHGIPEALLAQQCVGKGGRLQLDPERATDMGARCRFAVAAEIFALPAATKEAMPFDPWLDIGYQAAGAQQLDATGVPVHGDTKARAVLAARLHCASPPGAALASCAAATYRRAACVARAAGVVAGPHTNGLRRGTACRA